ncbi:MAG: hypothetical protein HY263_06960 [Chloroflexi bacterium]|nr:hypothetical protein [Chloroflexota bacterium]
MSETTVTFPIEMTASELGLVRTALEILEDTLGHEEAEELAEVQALLRRLPAPPQAG